MKNTKLVTGLSLIIFSAILGMGLANAKSHKSSNTEITNADQIQSQNKRHKMPHGNRKAAAVRLKQTHELQHQQKLLNSAQLEKGYTGHGQRGGQ